MTDKQFFILLNLIAGLIFVLVCIIYAKDGSWNLQWLIEFIVLMLFMNIIAFNKQIKQFFTRT
jgi:hypothetical protein